MVRTHQRPTATMGVIEGVTDDVGEDRRAYLSPLADFVAFAVLTVFAVALLAVVLV